VTEHILSRAEKALAIGDAAGAVSLVEAAARSNDVDAVMQLAVWRMRGVPLARDLSAARELLRRAVSIGHVDAALTEIALTANGSGGPIDWPKARLLLTLAARSDHVAAAHLTLLDRMDLSDDGSPRMPPSPREISRSPNVWRIPAFLSPDECRHVADTAAPLLEPALVIDPRTKRRISNPVRTSDSAAIGPAREDLVIRAINHRIAAASGTPVDHAEPLTILRYRPGQQYRLHVDTLPAAKNQRVRTMLIYLNQGYTGGETEFSANRLTMRCEAGDAIMFDNVLPDGSPDLSSRHAGAPVTSGAKWIASRWIRAARHDPWNDA